MAVLTHHRHQPARHDGEPPWGWAVVKALLGLLLVTAVIATTAGLVAYGVAKILIAMMAGTA